MIVIDLDSTGIQSVRTKVDALEKYLELTRASVTSGPIKVLADAGAVTLLESGHKEAAMLRSADAEIALTPVFSFVVEIDGKRTQLTSSPARPATAGPAPVKSATDRDDFMRAGSSNQKGNPLALVEGFTVSTGKQRGSNDDLLLRSAALKELARLLDGVRERAARTRAEFQSRFGNAIGRLAEKVAAGTATMADVPEDLRASLSGRLGQFLKSNRLLGQYSVDEAMQFVKVERAEAMLSLQFFVDWPQLGVIGYEYVLRAP
jgi:hypothetical protein